VASREMTMSDVPSAAPSTPGAVPAAPVTFQSGTGLDIALVQGPLAGLIPRTARLDARIRVAKALLPAPPEQLIPALLYLSQDPESEVKKAARDTLMQMPPEVLGPVLKESKHQGLLDAGARAIYRRDNMATVIALNSATADDTIRWLASVGNAALCDVIGRNQVRSLRYPAIIEALYFNPMATQGMIQGLFEIAIRSAIHLDHIPGFREAKALIMGEELPDDHTGLSDSEFQSAMLMALGQGELLKQLPAAEAAVVQEQQSNSLHALIAKMSIAQKVRIATVGDASVRKILIRDPKKMVALAVLKSPRITEGEVTTFAGNKSLSEELLSTICRNRLWCKDYAIRKALVFNPKTPLAFSMTFLRTLSAKDVKDCASSREVNTAIARAAKRTLDAEEQERNKKKKK
jgi:hypothetical protein